MELKDKLKKENCEQKQEIKELKEKLESTLKEEKELSELIQKSHGE